MSKSKAYKAKLHVLKETNLYQILGVSEEATFDDISKAYRVIAKELHPDVNQDLAAEEKKQAGAIFQKITSAFNTLKDSEDRARYDAELQAQIFREESLKKSAENNAKEKEKKQSSSTFTFKQVKFVDLEKIREDKQNTEKQKSVETFNQAKLLIENKKFDEASEILKTLVESFPNEARYHSHLGLALDGKGWTGYAQAEFKVALHYNPNDDIAKKYYKQAISSPKIIKKNIDNSNNYQNISRLQLETDEKIDPTSTTNLKDILSRVRGIFGKR